jgi:hypothetical protein
VPFLLLVILKFAFNDKNKIYYLKLFLKTRFKLLLLFFDDLKKVKNGNMNFIRDLSIEILKKKNNI